MAGGHRYAKVIGGSFFLAPSSNVLSFSFFLSLFQGEYAKASGMYKYEAESKSKSSSKSGAAVVPVCLPLCCAMPCTIM